VFTLLVAYIPQKLFDSAHGNALALDFHVEGVGYIECRAQGESFHQLGAGAIKHVISEVEGCDSEGNTSL
jgi:hypothetical protein